MINEIVFFAQSIIVAASSLIALYSGYHALVAFIAAQCLLANLFVTKQITLFGFNATCSDAFTIGATLSLNLLQEYYGKEITKKAIGVNFFILIFYLIASQIHLLYAPTLFDTTHAHFASLLQWMPRIVIASFSVYFFVQMLDFYIYGLLKKIFHNKYLIFRNYFSISLCQFVDTILFSFLGLYGIVQDVWQVILISYVIKLAAIIVSTPFIWFSRTKLLTPKLSGK